MAIRQQILQVRRFHDLMPYRVREILLVSSPYDAFTLEEDGQLTEQVFFEYRDVSLSGPPRVTHVPTGEDALRLLHARRYDLILVMTSLADMGVNALGRRGHRHADRWQYGHDRHEQHQVLRGRADRKGRQPRERYDGCGGRWGCRGDDRYRRRYHRDGVDRCGSRYQRG